MNAPPPSLQVAKVESQARPAPTICKFDHSGVGPCSFFELVMEISARMVKATAHTLGGEILRSLQEIFLLLQVERGGLLEVSEEAAVTVSHAWYAEGIGEVSEEINLAELFPWTYRKCVIEGEPVAIASLDDLPSEAVIDHQSHLAMKNQSSLTIPLYIGQRVHHLFAINALGRECAWSGEIIQTLRLLGEIMVSALQRREFEQELVNTTERLDLAAESADVGLWELDLDTDTFWLTDKTRQLFGYEAGFQLTLARFLEEIHAEDRSLILTAIEAAHREGKKINVEYRVPAADGQVRWMCSKGRLQPRSGKKPSCLLGVTMEVTRRKWLEGKLQEQLLEISALREQLEQENAFLRSEAATSREFSVSFGVSRSMKRVAAQVQQVAATSCTVLIQGETGTGKELIAQAIHRNSERGKQPLVKVNCAALPAALVESELFGREKGAFTGALSRQMGRFELANGATIFLDEIAEMPLETQAKLLRVLQEGEFERLGSPRTIKVDVRVIAATNRDLAEEVAQKRFRPDLYYRLNVFPIHLPPLRERPEDIPKLVWEFVNEFGERMGKQIRRIASSDMQALVVHSWPGNIRELRNVVEHAMIVSNGDVLQLHHPESADPQAAASLSLEEMERQHISKVLRATHGKIKGPGGAAERLGLNPSTLYSRMRKLGINPPPA